MGRSRVFDIKLVEFCRKYWAFILIFSFLIYYGINESIIGIGNEDFRIFIAASENLKQEKDLYKNPFDMGNGAKNYYIYPPFFALILIPFHTLFNYKFLLPLWIFFNIWMCYRIIQLIICYVNNKLTNPFILFTTALTLRFIMHNFDLGQMTILWVYLMIEAYSFSIKRQYIKASILISLGVAIKIMPILMFLYWVIYKEFKPIFYSIIGIIVFTLLPLLFFDIDYICNQYYDCIKTLNPFQIGYNLNLFSDSTQSLPSLVAHINRSLNLNMNNISIQLVTNSLRILLIGFLYITYIKNKKNSFLIFSLCLLGSTLVMPHQQHYSFFSAICLNAFIVNELLSTQIKSKSYFIGIILFIISITMMLICSELFVGKQLGQYFKFQKFIGIGSLFLLGSVYFFQKNKSNNLHQI